MDYIMKKDSKLKHAAIKIFGHIVENAWVATWSMGSDREIRSKIKRVSECVVDQGGSIEIGSDKIVIEFTTGKRVVFWGSEWSGIKPMGKQFKDIDE